MATASSEGAGLRLRPRDIPARDLRVGDMLYVPRLKSFRYVRVVRHGPNVTEGLGVVGGVQCAVYLNDGKPFLLDHDRRVSVKRGGA